MRQCQNEQDLVGNEQQEMAAKLRSGRSLVGYLQMIEEIFLRLVVLVSVLVGALVMLPARLLGLVCELGGARKRFKSVVITGASAGIGEQFAYCHAREKARLVLIARSADKLQAVADKCKSLGAEEVVVAVGSVADKDFMAETIRQAHAAKPLDLVVANAGYIAHTDGMEDPLVDGIYPAIDANVLGTANTVVPAAELMRERGEGQIAIMASAAAFFKPMDKYWASYTATKCFQLAYGENLRRELRAHNVGVSIACPGYTKSAMTDAIKAGGQPLPGVMTAAAAARYLKGQFEWNRGVITFGLGRYLSQTAAPLPPLLAEYLTPVINFIFIGQKYDKIKAYAKKQQAAATAPAGPTDLEAPAGAEDAKDEQ